MSAIEIVIREWRDGSLHVETHVVSLYCDALDQFSTHLVNPQRRFRTRCGLEWFGRLSASGWQEGRTINCPSCLDTNRKDGN